MKPCKGSRYTRRIPLGMVSSELSEIRLALGPFQTIRVIVIGGRCIQRGHTTAQKAAACDLVGWDLGCLLYTSEAADDRAFV